MKENFHDHTSKNSPTQEIIYKKNQITQNIILFWHSKRNYKKA